MFSAKKQMNDEQAEASRLFISPTPLADEPGWSAAETEGQLAVDVLETESELIIVATMAGTKPEDIYLHLHNDFLTIRGRRSAPIGGLQRYFLEECFWGKFSRTIVLPVEVKGEQAQSEYRFGVLTIRLPKAGVQQKIPILVVEE
jgi:HSP20 family protein